MELFSKTSLFTKPPKTFRFEKVALCVTEADDLFFIRQYRVLIELGFVEVGDFTLAGMIPTGFHRAFVHSEHPIYAVISHAFPRKPEKYLFLFSPLSDGPFLFSDNRTIPDEGQKARFQRLPGAGAGELLTHHKRLLKELLDGGLKARPVSREGFFLDYFEQLIIEGLSKKGTPRREAIAAEIKKLPPFDPQSLLKKSSKPPKLAEIREPLKLEKNEKKGSHELKEIKKVEEIRKEPAEQKGKYEQPEKIETSAPIEKAEKMPIDLEKSVPSLLKFIPPSDETSENVPLVRFDQIPTDAAAPFPFEARVETAGNAGEAKEEEKEAIVEKTEKPTRVKAPDKCPACGEPVLSPLASYCRKCKAYLR